jgi:hypothetical protein
VTGRGRRDVLRVPEMRCAAILGSRPQHRSRGRQSASFTGSAARSAERHGGARMSPSRGSRAARVGEPTKQAPGQARTRSGRAFSRLNRSSGHGSSGASPNALPLLPKSSGGRSAAGLLCMAEPSVMIEKSAASLWARLGRGLLDLNHTRVIDSLVSFRSRNSFRARRTMRRISRSGH